MTNRLAVGTLCKAAVLLLFAFLLFPVSASAQTDTTPPKLVDVTIDPPLVDVSSGPQTVNIQLHLTDDLSGTSNVQVYVYSPTFGQQQFGFGNLSSGDNLDGVWTVPITIPQFSEAGDWVISYVYVTDTATNTQYIYTGDLQNLGFPYSFTVVSLPDTTGPKLTALSIVPNAVNTSAADQQVTFTMHLTDDISGANFDCFPFCYYAVYMLSPTGKQYQGLADYSVSLLNGSFLDGDWTGIITFPRYSESGNWLINFMTLKDAAANQTYLQTADLQAGGFPYVVNVTSAVADVTPAKVSSLSFGPNFVDTTLGPKLLTVNLGITDNLSGFQYGYGWFYSPSGGQQAFLYFSQFSRIAGTATAGTYQYKFNLPQYSEAGTWTLNQLQLYDNVNNYVSFTGAQLSAMGFPTQLVVVLPSKQTDGTVSGGGTIQDEVFGDRASITVPPGVIPDGTTVSIDVFTQNIQLPIPQGYSVAGTNYVNLSFNPEPAMPLPAPGVTLVLPIPVQMNPGDQLTLFKVDPVSGNLVPEPKVGGGVVIGTVNADGLSATFTGVGGLSVVVGLVRSSVVPGDVDGDGAVSCADMNIVKTAFGKRLGQAGFDSRADTNKDNIVNIFDLAYVSRNLPAGTTCKFIDPKTKEKTPTARFVKSMSKGITK